MGKSTKVERRKRRLRITFNLIIIVTLIVIIVTYSLKSDFFNINSISIRGNSNLSKEKILHTSSITQGENIFRISTRDAEEEILKLAYIKSVEVKRKLPKGINIKVDERKEKLLVKNLSMFHLVDGEGIVLNQVDSDNKDLPVVLGLKTDKIEIGDNLFAELDLQEFTDLIIEGDKLDILKDISRINIDRQENVNLLINSGIDVAFGPLDNVKYKIRLLDEILTHGKENDILIDKIIMDRGEHPIIVVDD